MRQQTYLQEKQLQQVFRLKLSRLTFLVLSDKQILKNKISISRLIFTVLTIVTISFNFFSIHYYYSTNSTLSRVKIQLIFIRVASYFILFIPHCRIFYCLYLFGSIVIQTSWIRLLNVFLTILFWQDLVSFNLLIFFTIIICKFYLLQLAVGGFKWIHTTVMG